MRRISFILIALLVLGACATKPLPPQKTLPSAHNWRNNIMNVVFIYNTNEDGEILNSGTGFVIDKAGLILTVNHLFTHPDTDKTFVKIRTDKGFVIKKAAIKSRLAGCDLALLQVDYGFKSQVLVREFNLETGEYLTDSENIKFSRGNFYMNIYNHQILTGNNITVDMRLFNMAIAPGASGSPIFDKNGNAVGVLGLNAPLKFVGSVFTWGVPIKYWKTLLLLDLLKE